jgi:hypothetical protein
MFKRVQKQLVVCETPFFLSFPPAWPWLAALSTCTQQQRGHRCWSSRSMLIYCLHTLPAYVVARASVRFVHVCCAPMKRSSKGDVTDAPSRKAFTIDYIDVKTEKKLASKEAKLMPFRCSQFLGFLKGCSFLAVVNNVMLSKHFNF